MKKKEVKKAVAVKEGQTWVSKKSGTKWKIVDVFNGPGYQDVDMEEKSKSKNRKSILVSSLKKGYVKQ